MSYYNGVIFQGFIPGVPDNVLSGGRYDKLMQKFGKDCGAVGFAVFTDLIDMYRSERPEYDVSALVLYGANESAEKLSAAVAALNAESVAVYGENDGGAESVKAEKTYIFRNGRLEENA